jgi:pyruvate formate lyase activating enzyme
MVMMDLKHMDPDKHRAATGVSNELILANARRLAVTDKPLLFRIPVVPTINDTPEEIGAVAAFVRQLADLRLETSKAHPPALELLTFHRLAADKYRSLGMSYRASDLEVPTKEKMEELKQAAISQGITIWA